MTTTSSSFNSGEQNRDLNQYWYSDKTIQALCEEITLNGNKVAFLSTPSLYFAFPESVRAEKGFKLFEYDRKWDKDPGFVFYDYNEPDKIPVGLWQQFDYIVVDPPFITKEVWDKYIQAVTTLGVPKKAPAPGAAPQIAFKVLFTTVLENHSILEDLLDQPLFIPHFRPTVVNLTYQYSCFINYPHFSGNEGVARINDEIPAEDGEQLQARRLANDLRESEVEFLNQMRLRRREGEQQLPAPKEGIEAALRNNGTACGPVGAAAACVRDKDVINGGGGSKAAATNLDNVPISAMKWGHIPEGLTEYKDGASADGDDAASVPAEAYGPVYVAALKKREALEQFKKAVDFAFKRLEAIVHAKEAKLAAADGEAKRAELVKNETEELAKHAQRTGEIAAAYAELCANSPATSDDAAGTKKDQSLLQTMKSFVARLSDSSISANEANIKEFAIDATRNFKSPAFNRQKDLLQVMKVEKKRFAAPGAAAPAAPAAAL